MIGHSSPSPEHTARSPITDPMRGAAKWLAEHNGDGHVERWGTIVAAGERAPIMVATWKRLQQLGFVEYYGRKRIRLTDSGKELADRTPIDLMQRDYNEPRE